MFDDLIFIDASALDPLEQIFKVLDALNLGQIHDLFQLNRRLIRQSTGAAIAVIIIIINIIPGIDICVANNRGTCVVVAGVVVIYIC